MLHRDEVTEAETTMEQEGRSRNVRVRPHPSGDPADKEMLKPARPVCTQGQTSPPMEREKGRISVHIP